MSNIVTNQKLTGNFYYKKTWLGMILMVEVIETIWTNIFTPDCHEFKRYVKSNEGHILELKKQRKQ